MSEYIFRTEEPIEYCYGCPINNQENGRCRLGVETSGCEIPKKCHLVEVPTHGRLIDADILRMKYEYGEGRKKVDESPTVLGASKERK